MNHITESIACALVVFLLSVTTTQAGLTDNLELYSSMDSASGSIIPDDSGNGYDGTFTGDSTQLTLVTDGGPLGSGDTALQIDRPASGTAGYVDYGNGGTNRVFDPGTGAFTVSAWFNASVTNNDAKLLVSKGSSGSSGTGWCIFAQAGEIICRAREVNASGAIALSKDIVVDQWYHVAMVFDRGTNHLRCYLNGSENNWEADCSGGGLSGVYTFVEGANFSDDATLHLGTNAAGGNAFDGMVDDFAIWSRALSSSEISDIYNGAALSVPEPNAFVLFFAGFVSLALWCKKR